MMPLASPARRSATTHTAHDAYGTFDGDDDLYSGRRPPPPHRQPKRSGAAGSMRALAVVSALALGVCCVLLFTAPPPPPPRVVSPAAAGSDPFDNESHPDTRDDVLRLQRVEAEDATQSLSRLETKFLAGVDRSKIREFLHAYASAPHPAGSKQDYETAVYTAKQLESFGINATIKEYYPLLSLPVHRRVAIVEPAAAARELNLTEASVKGDACTTNADALPPFLAYAASGNVTASVVYANMGRPEDFQYLLDQNVTLKGKIALVRYGGNYRGLKVMAAEQRGMAGVLIYSDPHDDGFVLGPVYPDGPWRPEDSFQRGASIFLSLATGDPLTPGYASNLGAPYLSIDEATTIPHIPALPLSYGQAKHILASLGGKKAPLNWQGSLAIAGGYHVGDDEATVLNLDLEMDNKIGPIWNVIGTIDGVEEPEQHVLIGNHRDAWVCGAVDPSSGSAVMLEIARNLGDLLKSGWKPRRTLILGSWDGEEPGLLGSTEWAEDHATSLKKHAVAYINVDSVVGPFVAASGTPSIAEFMLQTAKALPANGFFGNATESSLFEQWTQQTASKRALLGAAVSERGTLGPDHMIGFLGSGTDFTPFYQHLGIISANLGFSIGPSMYGVYHSSMDSLQYVETIGDPNYETQAATAKWWGLIALRLVDEPIVPFDFSTYGQIMADALVDFEAEVAGLQRTVDFSKLYSAITTFSANADAFQKQVLEFTNNQSNEKTRRQLNTKLVTLERELLSDAGLPHRPWFKHVIFGPGFYEGYSGTAFPGIADGIAFKDDSAAIQDHVDEVTRAIKRAAAVLQLS